uniref:polynucleotide adenylyltransferase n=1 Tax=Meloidogyne javanica TaxID=6303 RepID=A0A915N7F6_MELJA
MLDETRFYLYQKFSSPKLDPKESEEVELRMVIPLMLNKLIRRLINIEEINPHKFLEIENRIETFRNCIINVKPNEKICTPRAVCLILNFSELITNVEKKGLERDLNKLLNWRHEKICIEEQQINEALEQMREDMKEEHSNFIHKYANVFKYTIGLIPGSSTKMEKFIQNYKLIPSLQQDELFYDDFIAKEHCFNVIIRRKDKQLNIASLIACRMILWARWMNKLLEVEENLDNEGLSRKHLNKVWINRRLFLQSKFDELFVMDISSLEKKEKEMALMQAKLNEFVLEQLDKYIAVGISDKVEEEWIKIETSKYEIEGNLEKYIQHVNWVKGKITDFIIKSLLEPEKPDITKAEKDQIFEIRVNLSVELSSPEAKEALRDFVGYSGIIRMITEFGWRTNVENFGINSEELDKLRRVLREYDSDLLTHKHLKWSSFQKAKREIKELIKNWIPFSHQNKEKEQNTPNEGPKFLLSGSHRLGAATINSDIDGVILVARKEENSLTVKQLDEVIEKFREEMPNIYFEANNETIIRLRLNTLLGMIYALSGVRSTLRFVELLDKNINKFRLAYITVKLWAKNHYIYGGKFGFLNGSSIAVLVSKFVLENSNKSLIAIIMELFRYLVNYWFKLELDEEKMIIVETTKDYENTRKIVDWNLDKEIKQREEHFKNLLKEGFEKHSKTLWPIILPGFPTQNTGFNINGSTDLIIRGEIKGGFDKFRALQGQFENLSGNKSIDKSEQIWKDWLDGGKFSDKYDNYLAIICLHTELSSYGPQFCEFTETRVRLSLLSIVENKNPDIEYCHVSPTKYLDNKPCPKEFVEKRFLDWICNVWIVGIKGGSVDEINETLSKNIFRDFNKLRRGKKLKLSDKKKYRLETKFFVKDELKKIEDVLYGN